MTTLVTFLEDETLEKVLKYKNEKGYFSTPTALNHIIENYLDLIENVDKDTNVKVDDPFKNALKHEDLVHFEEIEGGGLFKFYTPLEEREPNVYYDSVFIKTWDDTGVDLEDGYVTNVIAPERLVVRVKEV